MARIDWLWAVRRVDAGLRWRQGIEEFSADPECIFRISRDAARRTLRLSDGSTIRPGDPVLQIHYWNEQMPPIPAASHDALWAARFRRRAIHSLALLAAAMTREPRFADTVAVYAAPAFSADAGAAITSRISRRLGFDVLDEIRKDGLVHAWLDSLLIWILMRTFNPVSARGRGISHERVYIWISRRKLLERYAAEPGGAARPAVMEQS